jgi:hypothetical protein
MEPGQWPASMAMTFRHVCAEGGRQAVGAETRGGGGARRQPHLVVQPDGELLVEPKRLELRAHIRADGPVESSAPHRTAPHRTFSRALGLSSTVRGSSLMVVSLAKSLPCMSFRRALDSPGMWSVRPRHPRPVSLGRSAAARVARAHPCDSA